MPDQLEVSEEQYERLLRAFPGMQRREAPPLGERLHGAVFGSERAGPTALSLYQEKGWTPEMATAPIINIKSLLEDPLRPGATRALATMASEMTSPVAAALIPAGGFLGAAVKGIFGAAARSAIGRVVNAGFGTVFLADAIQKAPKLRRAIEEGRGDEAIEIATYMAAEAPAGAFAMRSAILPRRPGPMEMPKTFAERKINKQGTELTSEIVTKHLTSKTARGRKQMEDDLLPMLTIERLAAKPIADVDNPYIRARTFAGVGGKVLSKYWDLGDNIAKPAARLGITQNLQRWLSAKHQLELKELMGERYLTEGNLTSTQLREKLGWLEASIGKDKLKTFSDEVRRIEHDLIEDLVDAGMLRRSDADNMFAKYEFHVPQQRIKYMADDVADAARENRLPRRSFDVKSQNVVYERSEHGSTEEVLDPLLGIIRNINRGTTLAERNRVARSVANLHNDPALKKIVRPYNKNKPLGENESTFSAYINGEREDFVAPFEVVSAMKGLDKTQADFMTRWVGTANRFYRALLTTFNPTFQMRQLWRDFQTAAHTTGGAFKPWHLVDGLMHSLFRDKTYRDFQKSGAAFSGWWQSDDMIRGLNQKGRLENTFQRLSEGRAKSMGRVVRNPLELVRSISETIEMGPRIGVYNMARKRGMSELSAGFLARNATIDFFKSGLKMRTLNSWIPFLNARTQGTLNLLNAYRKDPARTAFVSTVYVGLPTFYTYMHNVTNFKNTWDKIASWEKENYFHVIFGNETDAEGNPTNVLKIPKGDVGKWWGTPIEKSLEWMRFNEKPEFEKMALDLASDMSPIEFAHQGKFAPKKMMAVFPPLARTFIELAANEKFYFGTPIEKASLQQRAPAERFTDKYAHRPSVVAASRWLNENTLFKFGPAPLEYMISSFLGPLAGAAVRSPVRVGPTGDLIEQRSMFKRAIWGATGRGKEEPLYEAAQEYEETVHTEKGIKKRYGREQAIDLVNLYSDNPKGARGFLQAAFEGDRLNDDTWEGFMSAMEQFTQGVTPFERFIGSRKKMHEVRGMVLADILLDSDQQMAAETVARWDKLEILEPDTAKFALKEMHDRGQLSSWLRGYVAPHLQPTAPPPTAAIARTRTPPGTISQADLVRKRVTAAARKYKIPLAYALGIAGQESNFNPGALGPPIAGTSDRAIGVMQLMPETAAELEVDPYDMEQNIDGGMRYLRQLIDHFKGDLAQAKLAYHSGIGNVIRGNIGDEGRKYVIETEKRRQAELESVTMDEENFNRFMERFGGR